MKFDINDPSHVAACNAGEQQQKIAIATAEVKLETNPAPRKLGDQTNPKPPAETSEKAASVGFATGRIYLPVALRNVTWDSSKSIDDRIKSYGKWQIKILRPCSLGMGVYANPGDECEVIGDTARLLVELGQAEFCDAKLMEEKSILEKADQIRKTNPARRDPDRFTPEKKKSGWMSGVLQPTPASV